MLSPNLRKKILEYIDNHIELEDLEDWYVARLPLLLADPDSSDSDLVSLVELGLAELSAGILDENDFRHLLEEALQKATIFEEISFVETNEPKPDEDLYRIIASTSSVSVSSASYQNELEEAIFAELISS